MNEGVQRTMDVSLSSLNAMGFIPNIQKEPRAAGSRQPVCESPKHPGLEGPRVNINRLQWALLRHFQKAQLPASFLLPSPH